jgi:A/G-specific adenine glycosylase
MVTLTASLQKPKAARLLAWYDAHRRDLPWRAKPGETVDPYRVWLSEIMLQQTTVTAVRPYFEAFLARWPTVEALAGAPVDEVMKAWAGLGYYARARNLHACAQSIVSEHGGLFPATEAELLRLPGIGPYTAAAVAAIAFDAPCVALDGNVERVVTRLFAIATPTRLAKAEIKEKTQSFLSQARPGDFAQALMDLGATLCTPRAPSCGICPFIKSCSAFIAGHPEAFPVKPQKSPKPNRRGAVFVLRCGDSVLLRQRAPRGLLGGMTAFPATPFTSNFSIIDACAHAPIETGWRALPGAVSHVFTHFSLELTVFLGHVGPPAPFVDDCRWAAARELGEEGLPTLMRKVAIHAELLEA